VPHDSSGVYAVVLPLDLQLTILKFFDDIFINVVKQETSKPIQTKMEWYNILLSLALEISSSKKS